MTKKQQSILLSLQSIIFATKTSSERLLADKSRCIQLRERIRARLLTKEMEKAERLYEKLLETIK